MPFVMLRSNWPNTFRRTITMKGQKQTLEFKPGVPVDLTPSEISALQSDIGVALVPVEFDEKARPRVITEDVVAEELQPEPEQPVAAEPKHRRSKKQETISEPSDAD